MTRLQVASGLALGFGVSDHWFCEVPSPYRPALAARRARHAAVHRRRLQPPPVPQVHGAVGRQGRAARIRPGARPVDRRVLRREAGACLHWPARPRLRRGRRVSRQPARCAALRDRRARRSRRARVQRRGGYCTTGWRERACTRPASRSRRGSAANRATTRRHSHRHTSSCTTSPKPNGSPSSLSDPSAPPGRWPRRKQPGRTRGTLPAETRSFLTSRAPYCHARRRGHGFFQGEIVRRAGGSQRRAGVPANTQSPKVRAAWSCHRPTRARCWSL
jgi:hypothetical protein